MIRVKKIIAPTDLSKLSREGVRYALELALEQGSAVIVYNVIGEEADWFSQDQKLNPAAALVPQQVKRLAEFIDEHCADLSARVALDQVVEPGVPYKKIIEKARSEEADLIVMSTHGRTGLDQFMMGSVTQKVVALAPCPVLSIRPSKR